MSIISINTIQTGLVGVLPSISYINTSDTLATVLGTGYLNHEVQTGYSFSLPCIAAVSTLATPTSLPQVGWFTVQHSGVNWNLVATTNPGDVTLPTILNHIATFNNTTGGIGEDPATAISGGNIQAGTTAIAGALISTAGTATGTLQLKAVSSAGAYNAIISNASLAAQSSTFSLADPVSATSNILQAPSALVSGNLIKASGTTGLIVDTGITATSVSSVITQIGNLYQVAVTMNTAAVVGAYATPVSLIAAVAGKVAVIHSATVYTASTGNTAYATGVAPIIQYGTTVHGAGTIAVGAGLVTGDITAASSQVRTIGPAASAVYTGISNTAVTFSCTTAYTAGTGTNVTITLVYELITATV